MRSGMLYADCACHQKMRKSCFLVLVLLAVFSPLLATFDGSSVLDLKLQPERPNNVYYALRGSTFVLNCTATVGNYVWPLNLTWQHNKKWLFGEVQHINIVTVQLTLSSISRDNNGIYWCGPKHGHMSQGVNMSLIVADPPSPPRNLRYSVVGAMDDVRQYQVFWSASSVTGGLPVNYTVKMCVNDSYASVNGVCNWSVNPDCRPTNVLSTDKDFFCVLQKTRDFVSPCEKSCNYTLSVVAENAVGSGASWRYLPFISLYSATPWPPSHFNVKTTNNPNELRVSWMSPSGWRYAEMEYTIVYHARNEMENKTKVISVENTSTEGTLLKKLKAFVEYYVYLIVRFVNDDGKKSAPSAVQGPCIVKTPAGEPDTPTNVRGWPPVMFPGNPALRNVTVEWELARTSSWHGTPDKHVVYCSPRDVSKASHPDLIYLDAASNRVVLQRLDSAKSYDVYIKKCNKEQLCSPDGNPAYIIKEIQDNSTSPNNKGKPISKRIALIAVPVVVTSVMVALFMVRWFYKHGTWPRLSLKNRLTLQPPVPPYNYVEPEATSEYDELNFNENQL